MLNTLPFYCAPVIPVSEVLVDLNIVSNSVSADSYSWYLVYLYFFFFLIVSLTVLEPYF